jgi:hypothetical protein
MAEMFRYRHRGKLLCSNRPNIDTLSQRASILNTKGGQARATENSHVTNSWTCLSSSPYSRCSSGSPAHPGLRGRGDSRSRCARTGTSTAIAHDCSGSARRRQAEAISFPEPVLRTTFRSSRGSQRAVRRRPSHDQLMQKETLRKAAFTNRRYSILMQFFTLLTSMRIPPN